MLKSAYELAMERLGDDAPKISDEQKAKLAEIDARYRAMIAEKEILYAERLHGARTMGDPSEVEMITQELAAEKNRLEEARNRDKDRCRKGE